ncbi:hypothetical protein Q1695_005492 [Nippostrongylus brasiliensis]|nr:hypothetical protein Q1695_005492 [Nippostrongylus brasiliensis]
MNCFQLIILLLALRHGVAPLLRIPPQGPRRYAKLREYRRFYRRAVPPLPPQRRDGRPANANDYLAFGLG